MIMDLKSVVLSVITVIVVIFGVFVGVFLVNQGYTGYVDKKDALCKERFGQEWFYKDEAYESERYINIKTGEAKYI